MALPQDGQNANALATVKEVPTGKKLIFVDPTTNEGGVITLEDLTTQILKNLTSQTFALDQGTKTLPAALNELNSKALSEVRKSIWRIAYYQKCTCCHSWINHNRESDGCFLPRRFYQYWLYRDHISTSGRYHCQQFG